MAHSLVTEEHRPWCSVSMGRVLGSLGVSTEGSSWSRITSGTHVLMPASDSSSLDLPLDWSPPTTMVTSCVTMRCQRRSMAYRSERI
jgi:hypothetical protein